jgi:hypothetical protein
MPKLEARFHPWPSGDQSYVVVGYVIWDGSDSARPEVEPAPSLRDARAPRTILATLRHLVASHGSNYAQLTALRSCFWSFVPTSPSLIASGGR